MKNDAILSVSVETPLTLENDFAVMDWKFNYQTFGAPATDSNVVLVLPGLSASTSLRSTRPQRGWWETIVQDGGAIDTRKYHVVCASYLGSPFSNLPASSPVLSRNCDTSGVCSLSIRDIARSVSLGLTAAGYQRIHASVGTSMGGMVQLALLDESPHLGGHALSISSAVSPHGFALLARGVQRKIALTSLKVSAPGVGDQYVAARAMACLLYRGVEDWSFLEGMNQSGVEERINKFLSSVQNFCEEYPVSSFLALSRAIDNFNGRDLDLTAWGSGGFHAIVLGSLSDTLYPFTQQADLAQMFKKSGAQVSLREIDALGGHDSFLINQEEFVEPIRKFMEEIRKL